MKQQATAVLVLKRFYMAEGKARARIFPEEIFESAALDRLQSLLQLQRTQENWTRLRQA